MEKIVFRPIGMVHNGVTTPGGQEWKEVVSEIHLREGLEEALDGVEDFSHLIILYYMHRRPPGRFPSKVHPRGRLDLPEVGVLASRHSSRPNSIGLTTVKLLERQGLVLRVQGLDAYDGTPVIDIKPFVPGFDLPQEAKVPPWVKKIQEMPHIAHGDEHR